MLYVSGEIFISIPTTGSVAALDLQLPDDPSLVGIGFYNQALVLDPAIVGPGGIVLIPAALLVTNAATASIGAK